MRPVRILALTLLSVVALAGCSSPSGGAAGGAAPGAPGAPGAAPGAASGPSPGAPGTVVVGASGSRQSRVLAEVYAQALASAGFTVTTRLDVGGRATYLAELRTGALDVVPDYLGALLRFYQPGSPETAPGAVAQALANYLPGDLSALDASRAATTDTIVVSAASARRDSLTSIADLARLTGPIALAGPGGLAGDGHGPAALRADYTLSIARYDVTETSAQILAALGSGADEAAILPASDPALLTGGLVGLSDPRHAFLAENVVPVVRGVAATPRLRSVLNPVSAALSTAALARMDQQVAAGADPAAVARAWLRAQGLA